MKIIASWIISLFGFLYPSAPPAVVAETPVVIESGVDAAPDEAVAPAPGAAVCPEVMTPSCPVVMGDQSHTRIRAVVYEQAQQSIQPVLITDGVHTKEMEQAFASFKQQLGKETAAALRDPKTLLMSSDMKVAGEAFADGISAPAIRNTLGLYGYDVQIVVYTDFAFSPMNHRDPTGVYFRSQYQTLVQNEGDLFNAQTEADTLFWISYLHL